MPILRYGLPGLIGAIIGAILMALQTPPCPPEPRLLKPDEVLLECTYQTYKRQAEARDGYLDPDLNMFIIPELQQRWEKSQPREMTDPIPVYPTEIPEQHR